MTVLADMINGGNFVLEHITSIEPIREVRDEVETGRFWRPFALAVVGYRFRVNLGADYVFIQGDTRAKAEELRIDLIKRLAGVTV